MRLRLPVALLLALLAPPLAGGHGLISLDVVVPAACLDEQACLTTREGQPALHAGETVDVHVYNDDHREHRVHVTTGVQVDEGAPTPTERALVSSQRLPANASETAGELAIPADAEALYVWCSVDDHEAEGEHLRLALEPPHGDDRSAPAAGVAGVLVAVGVALRRRC